MDPIGKVAYDAYCESSQGKSLVSGEPLPNWHALKQEIQDAWTYVGTSLESHVRVNNETILR